MLSKILFASLILSLLVGCSGAPTEPEIEVCTPILKKLTDGTPDFATSYFFCTSDLDPDNTAKQKRVPFIEYISTRPVTASVDDYAAKNAYRTDVKKWAEKHCRK